MFVTGFAELQMEKLDVVDSFETIPFLDYTHFVLRAFFPEVNYSTWGSGGCWLQSFFCKGNSPGSWFIVGFHTINDTNTMRRNA